LAAKAVGRLRAVDGDGGMAEKADVKQAINGAVGGDRAAVGSATTTVAGRPRIADLDGRKASNAHVRQTLNGAAGGGAAVGSAGGGCGRLADANSVGRNRGAGCGRVPDTNSVGQKPGVWHAVGRVNDGFSLEQAWSDYGVGRHGACWEREVDAATNVRIVRGVGSGAEMWEVRDGPMEIEGTVAAL